VTDSPDSLESESAGKTARLFIALSLPEPVRNALATLPTRLTGVNWTRPEQLHVTLRFIGEIAESAIAGMAERLASVQVASFLLPVEGVGTFPANRPPRVVWIGTGSGHPRLFQLRQRVDDALLSSGLNLDVRTFHPHVTLARCTENAGASLTQWLATHEHFAAPPFRVESFDLYSSELRPGGAVHTLRQRFPLR
jgi:RNA 2',3'-cyclic 3'-phosphodiesterase